MEVGTARHKTNVDRVEWKIKTENLQKHTGAMKWKRAKNNKQQQQHGIPQFFPWHWLEKENFNYSSLEFWWVNLNAFYVVYTSYKNSEV